MSAPEIATVARATEPANDTHRVLRPEFIRMVRRVHACGPKAVGELLMEVADREALALRLPIYAGLDPCMVAALDCRDFSDSILEPVKTSPKTMPPEVDQEEKSAA